MLIWANKKVPTIITIETIAATIKNSLSTPLKSPELDIDVAADLLVPGCRFNGGSASGRPARSGAGSGCATGSATAGLRTSCAERCRRVAGFVGLAGSGGSGPASRVVR